MPVSEPVEASEYEIEKVYREFLTVLNSNHISVFGTNILVGDKFKRQFEEQLSKVKDSIKELITLSHYDSF